MTETRRPPHDSGKEAQGSVVSVSSFKEDSFLPYFILFSRSLQETFGKCGKRMRVYPAVPDVDFSQSLPGSALKSGLWIETAWPRGKSQGQVLALTLPLNRRVTLELTDHPLLQFPRNLGLTSLFQTCYAFDQVLIKRLEAGSLADMLCVALAIVIFYNSFMGI